MTAVVWPSASGPRPVPRVVNAVATSSQASNESWRRVDGKRTVQERALVQKHKECLEVERLNLVDACRLAVKALVDRACFAVIDDDSVELNHFCTVFEHVMLHGYRGPEVGLLSSDEPLLDYWHFLSTGLAETEAVTTVETMGTPQTGLGKCRTWLLICLVQKSLGSNFSQLVNHKPLLSELYLPYAVFHCEEGHLIAGLLVALNSVDFCLCLKDNSLLDTPVIPVVNYSFFMHFKPSAVGNLADEQEWWDAMDDDSLPHAPRDSHSADANALLMKISESAKANGNDEDDGAKQRSHSVGGSVVADDGGSVNVGDFVRLQRHVSREREQKNYFEEMLKQRSRELQESLRCQQDLEQKFSQAQEAADLRVKKVLEQADQEREQLQSIILELHDKVLEQEQEIRRLRQQLQLSSSPSDSTGFSALANLFSRSTAQKVSPSNQPPRALTDAVSPTVNMDEVVTFVEATDNFPAHSLSPSKAVGQGSKETSTDKAVGENNETPSADKGCLDDSFHVQRSVYTNT